MRKSAEDRTFYSMFERHKSVMLIIDPETGAIVDANRSAARYYGYPRKTLSTLCISDIDIQILPEMQAGAKQAKMEAGSSSRSEHRFPNGQVRSFGIESSLIRLGGRPFLLSIVHDTTEHKRMLEALERRQRQLLTLNRLSEIFHSPRPLDELYNEIVDEICLATGFPIAGIGLVDEERRMILIHGRRLRPGEPDRPLVELPVDFSPSGAVVRTGRPLVEKHLIDNSKYTTTGLAQTPAQIYIGYPMKIGKKVIGCLNVVHSNSIAVDMHTMQWIETLANYVAVLTARKREEEELKTSREQLREVLKGTQNAVEEERKHISLELHDELGQHLSLLMLDLGMLETDIGKKNKEQREKIRSMMGITDLAIRSVQRMSYELRPTLLDDLGLGAAVSWAVKEFHKRTKIKCEVAIDPPHLKIDQERSTVIFRILQEALTNVMRHAKATKVRVKLSKIDGVVRLKVTDNGVGISQKQINSPKSIGLTGMRERVRPWDGSVAITGVPGKKTEIIATVRIEP